MQDDVVVEIKREARTLERNDALYIQVQAHAGRARVARSMDTATFFWRLVLEVVGGGGMGFLHFYRREWGKHDFRPLFGLSGQEAM